MKNKILNRLDSVFVKSLEFLKQHGLISSLLVFLFFFLVFTLSYMKIDVLSSSDDHYFHFRFAERLLNDGFLNSFRDFKSLYFTNITNGNHFIYYNFLFYFVLLPFIKITPLYLAIKIYAITIASLTGFLMFFFLKKIDIKYPFWWVTGFFAVIGISPLWRLFLSRPFVFAPIIMLILLLAIHKRKNISIFIISFIYLFWHGATFYLIFIPIFSYLISYYIYNKKILWDVLAYSFAGVSLSILVTYLIDPGFFIYLKDNILGVISSIADKKIIIPEGTELYPQNIFDLLNQNIILFAMFLFSVVFFSFSFIKELKKCFYLDSFIKNKKIISFTLFLCAIIFFIAIPNISYRFSDFFLFFSWIFIVVISIDIFSYINFSQIEFKRFLVYSLLVCLIYLFIGKFLQLNEFFVSAGSYPETFSEVGNYISKNLKKGDIVFNADWSWFPQLYYYAPNQNYVIGLEPKLTYVYNERLYWLWSNMSKGYACEYNNCQEVEKLNYKNLRDKNRILSWTQEKGDIIADIIINDFKSHYIVSSINYVNFNNVLNNSNRFEKVLNSNNKYFIYKIID